MIVTELVIRVGTELVIGVGVETPCIVFFSFVGGYLHCPFSFLNWLRSPSPQAVLLANDVFSFSFWLEMILFVSLDVTAAFAVVASVVVAVVASAAAVVVALFLGGFFPPFMDYLGPPFSVRMVPRLQTWLAW